MRYLYNYSRSFQSSYHTVYGPLILVIPYIFKHHKALVPCYKHSVIYNNWIYAVSVTTTSVSHLGIYDELHRSVFFIFLFKNMNFTEHGRSDFRCVDMVLDIYSRLQMLLLYHTYLVWQAWRLLVLSINFYIYLEKMTYSWGPLC